MTGSSGSGSIKFGPERWLGGVVLGTLGDATGVLVIRGVTTGGEVGTLGSRTLLGGLTGVVSGATLGDGWAVQS